MEALSALGFDDARIEFAFIQVFCNGHERHRVEIAVLVQLNVASKLVSVYDTIAEIFAPIKRFEAYLKPISRPTDEDGAVIATGR